MYLLQNEDFKVLGKLVATSIIQGGPGFPVLSPAAYNYLSSGKFIDQFSAIPDPLISSLLDQVRILGVGWNDW